MKHFITTALISIAKLYNLQYIANSIQASAFT